MTLQTSAFTSYSAAGNAEDFENIIANVSPEDTPVYSMCERVKANNRVHQFQKDTLAAGAANQQLEGDVFANAALSATTTQNNVCQISYKVFGVTGTQEAMKHYGRGSELDYQAVKKGKELKKDLDVSVCANTAKVTGDATTARKMAGLVSWIATNRDKASDGTDPTGDGTDARTAGTARAFTEDLLLNALQTCYTNGAKPNKLVTGAFNKKQVASFAGGSTRQTAAKDKAVYASVDIYYGPYGEVLDVIPSRQAVSSVAMLLDDEYLKLAVLRPIQDMDLAIVADTKQRVILTEATFVPGTELAHGIVADLTTS
jgi:hypothetical protein